MKNNRIRLTSYISPDLDQLIMDYMSENNINTKSQAIERILIEYRYLKNEINFLKSLISGGDFQINSTTTQQIPSKTEIKEIDKVKDSISDIFSNMPD